jgi:DNA-binding NtrC family response regulator
VLEAASGAEALPICEIYGDGIDLLLSDMIMPGMSGIELMKKAAVLCPEIRTLLMSGYTDEALNTGDGTEVETAFIEKPFTPDALARKIRDVIES